VNEKAEEVLDRMRGKPRACPNCQKPLERVARQFADIYWLPKSQTWALQEENDNYPDTLLVCPECNGPLPKDLVKKIEEDYLES
jgi:uncharacterized protein YbaR (Trm112 family)